MKSILVIGMGRFGIHIAQKLTELGNEVMIVDKDEDIINELSQSFSNSLIGDCTEESVLASIGVEDFDICFVTIGTQYSAAFEITSILKDLGAKHIVVKAGRDRHIKLLKKLGANEVLYPEKEMAEHHAVKYSSDNVLDFINLGDDFSLYEIDVPKAWISKSVSSLDVRKKYKMNIVAIKSFGNVIFLVNADYVFRESDNIVVIGKNEDLQKYIN